MAFSDIELKRIDNVVGGLCRRHTRPDLRDKLRFEYRVKVHDVEILEIRPCWDGRPGTTEHGVAKVKFIRSRGVWRLFWMRQDLKWHGYEPVGASTDLEVLIGEVDRDPYGCFFG